jgi:hypothetical protein
MQNTIITSNWQKREMTDPYQVVATYFTIETLSAHRMYVRGVIRSAFIPRRNDLSKKTVLATCKDLEELIIAAWMINQEKKKSALTVEPAYLMQPSYFSNQQDPLLQWADMPRSLEYRDFFNPYKTLSTFFKCHPLHYWITLLKKLFRYANARKSLSQKHPDIDAIETLTRLMELLDALHLIDVREIYQIGGVMKDKLNLPTPRTDHLL